ncbi:MAG: hypothetical protein ORN57_02715, partial [Alphaproteobacteria bacterium]|nr:hypothetical protein [Alphaproteobacteria bacterium]
MLKKSLRLPSVRSVDDAKKLVIERDLSHVKLAVCDIDGVLRGKWVSREKFFSALDNGFGFCDIIFGWDCLDANYDNGIYTNRNSGYPDTQLRVAVETARNLPLDIDGPPFDPFHPSYSSLPPDPSDPSDPSGPSNYTGPAGPSPSYGQPRQAYDSVHSGPSSNPLSPRHFNNHSLLFLAESGEERGQDIVPRSLLKKIIAHGDSMGIAARAAAEFEFFLFRETAESVRAKHYRNLTPLTPGIFGYSLLRTGREHWFYEKLLNMSNAMDIPLEGLHTETGPGVLEAAIAATDILAAADRAALFKTFTKILAQKNGLMATFMAKWSHAYPGQSGHLHISLQNKDGRSLFFDKNKPNNMSDTMRYFIGGLQRLMPDLMPMLAPTVNSYMRITAGYWAPTSPSWGIENRTCALRVIGSS